MATRKKLGAAVSAAADRDAGPVTGKRPQGRPPRTVELERFVVYVAPEVKRALLHRIVDERCTISDLVERLLRVYLKL